MAASLAEHSASKDAFGPRLTARNIVLILGCAVHAGGVPSPAMRRRVGLALETARGLSGVVFMPIGGRGRFGPAEADVMQRLLLDAGVGQEAIIAVPRGDNTIRSLRACLPALLGAVKEAGAVVHVCTDAYHVLRCRMILGIWGVPSREGVRASAEPLSTERAWLRARDAMAVCKDVVLAACWRALQNPRDRNADAP